MTSETSNLIDASALPEEIADRPAPDARTGAKRVRVWDLPTRLFHWALVILIFTAWLTIENRWMIAHMVTGSLILGLVTFRLIWGFMGSTTSRFKHFFTMPWTAASYLRQSFAGKSAPHSGHNPAGGWMVFAMLGLISFQALTGFLANNDIGFAGPLSDLVSKETSDWFTRIHIFAFNLILLAVWMHVIAVFFYVLVKGQNLLAAMIDGDKLETEVTPGEVLAFAGWQRALIALIAAGSWVGFLYIL